MTQATVQAAPAFRAGVSQRGFFHRLLRKPLAVVAIAYLVLISLACALAPLLVPDDPLAQDLSRTLQLPSAAHLLGTDAYGRDVLSRVLSGGGVSLLGVVEALVVAAVVGPLLGLAAGFFGDRIDRVLSAVVTIALALPTTVVLLAVLAVFGSSLTAAMVTLGLIGSAPIARVVRGATLTVRNELYVAAAEVAGVRRWRILVRHIVPRLTGPIIVQLALFAALALAVQSGLAFLGLGVAPPAPSWGGGVAEAQQVILQTQWLLVPYGGVLALTILAFGVLGDAARDASVEGWSSERARRRTRRPAPVRSAPSASYDPAVLLTVSDLSIVFGTDGPPVVEHVSFGVRRGEILGVVGESGSGKTTTALSLIGLLPDTGVVTSGSALLDGVDLYRLRPKELAAIRGARVALVSQDPMSSLDPVFTVGQLMVEVIRRHERMPRSAASRRAALLLERVRLPDPDQVLRKYPHELSGGMAQRVCIALALSASPELLIADEPTTALDVTVQAEILELLRSIRDSTGMAVILVTHNLGVVADICDRAVVMREGQVVESGTTDELFAHPSHDYLKALLAATPTLLPRDATRPGRTVRA